MTRISTYSNLIASMREIHQVHWETGNQFHSYSGRAIMLSQRQAMKRETTFFKSGTTKNSKRKIVGTDSPQPLGERYDSRTGAKLDVDMSNLIQYRTYATTGTTVVAVAMKGGKTEIRKDGRVVSSTRVDGIGQRSIAILMKMNSGKKNPFVNWTTPDGKVGGSIERFDNTWKKDRNFMEKGRKGAMFQVHRFMNEGMQKALENAGRDTKMQPMRKAA